MTNPMPRQVSPLMAAILAKSQPINNNLELARSVNLGLHPVEEERVNKMVAQVLDKASDLEELIEQAESISPEAPAPVTKIESGPAQAPIRSGNFRIPDAHESQLWNPDITLDESQEAAVEDLAGQRYGCLIGAAGTGKTTVQKYLLHKLIYGDGGIPVRVLPGDQGLNIAVVAFTGMAAQVAKSNLPEWIQSCAKTIHGLLEFKPTDTISTKTGKATRIFVPSRNSMNKLDHDIVIIDEASMVGLDLWKQLLDALQPHCRIYMTGDLNQLPPVIGMPVFAFALSKWHVCELTKVHRQKEEGANRIIEVAHQILNGRVPTFDQTKDNPKWRVIGHKLSNDPLKAQREILSIANVIRNRKIDPEIDPSEPLVYDPYRDRIMTSGNGFDENMASAAVQQAPLNEALSLLIQPPNKEHPRYIIDAGRRKVKMAVGLRVMATKNEPHNTVGRVTNGMTGVVIDIYDNIRYVGDKKLFGPEEEVMAAIRERISAKKDEHFGARSTLDMLDDFSLEIDENEDLATAFGSNDESESEEDDNAGGLASHTLVIRFDNGSERKFSNKTGVESINLAFCSTVAKCQGSQFDTAVVIVHHAQKGQLSREWLYTAVTRATKRVIILYTEYGLRSSISKQRIHGKTIAEKVERYREMASEGVSVYAGMGVKSRIHVPLSVEELYEG